MNQVTISLDVAADDPAAASLDALALADMVREYDGVIQARRVKSVNDTMDLGNTVEIVLQSGTMLFLAKGIADWLRARRGTRLTFKEDPVTGARETVVSGVDPENALRMLQESIEKRAAKS